MQRKKRIILGLILLSYGIVGIDGSIVVTGLVKIAEDLRLSQAELSWVQNAYLIAFGGFMLMSGGLGEAYGRKRIFNISLVLFGLGSLGAGVAQSAGFMIGARFVQGIGAALLAPTSLALIMDYFEGAERVKAVAWYSSMSGLGMCVGLILGGAITSYASWRDGFLVNIPIVAVMLVLSCRTIDGKVVAAHRHFDIAGTLLSIAGIFCLLYGIDGAENAVLWVGIGAALIAVFVGVERRCANPLMPLYLFADADRRNAYIARALIIGATMGFHFHVSEFMQHVFGFTPLLTGCAFLPMNITTFVGALKTPALVNKFGNKHVLLFGLLLFLVGFGWGLTVDAESSYLSGIGIPMLFIGLGIGLTLSPLTNLGIRGVAHSDAGAASAVVNVAHQIGGAFGLSLMIAAGEGLSDMTARFHVAVLIGFCCMVGAVVFSCARPLWHAMAAHR